MTGRERRTLEAAEIAEKLGGDLEGENVLVDRLAMPGPQSDGAVVVLFDEAHLALAEAGGPAVVVAPAGLPRPAAAHALIRVRDPRLALARLSAMFDDRPLPGRGVHPTASVAEDASLGAGVRVGAGAVIGSGARLGSGVIVGERAVVGPGAVVGRDSRIHPGANVLDGVVLGERVIVHSGAVLGSDGFGFAPGPEGAVKLHHLGTVRVGDDVEIGANTCIDRGTLGDTVIGAGTKIDNLCQIAHNVSIGRGCLIAGHCGIAGSTRLGDGVIMAGGAGVADHLVIGDGAVLGAGAGVLKNIPAGETWLGYPAQPYRRFVRQSYLLGKLERIWDFVKRGEKAAQE